MKKIILLGILGLLLLCGCSDRPTSIAARAIVENAYPGMSADGSMPLHNGEAEAITFRLEYVAIEDVMAGYAIAPKEAAEWVQFANETTIGSKQTAGIPVTINIPADATDIPAKWEFGIRASDAKQKGFINHGILCSWLVTMR